MPNSAPTDSGLLSVVLPAFNEEEMAPRAADVISALLEQAQIPHELIFVDDGSRDRTWARIQEKSRALPQVRGVRFSRNFGKEAAIFAGLAQARGACCVVLDCDLQHPPEKIVDMYRLWQQGYQVVEGVKVSRGKESPLHTLAVRCLLPGHEREPPGWTCPGPPTSSCWTGGRWMCCWPCGRKTPSSGPCPPGSDFPPLRWSSRCGSGRRAAPSGPCAACSGMPSPIWPPSPPPPSSWSPFWGCWCLIASVVLSVHSLWQKFTGQALEGFTTVIILILFIGSILMICLGIIGYYIAKIYEEVKDRPRYILSDTCGEARHAEKDL